MSSLALAYLALALCLCIATSFTTNTYSRYANRLLRMQSDSSPPPVKGFGAPKAPAADKAAAEKDAGTKTYENMAKRGVPEYNIFLRPINGTDADWVPVGSMTIPRDVQVSKAVYEVEEELLKGTFKLYPKLKAFSDVRGETKGLFEYGSCLKAFPDEPITLLKKDEEAKAQEKTNFFTSWLSKITNPIDTTTLKNKGEMTIKQ